MSIDSMTAPTTTSSPHGPAPKVAAIAAVAVGIGLFMTVAAINVPHEASDGELVTWWKDSGNRMAGLVSCLFAVVVAVALPVVLNHLREMPRATRSPQWLAFASSMAAATSALWLVTGASRASIGHLVDVMDEPLPGVDVLRFVTATNYTLLGLPGMAVLGLTIAAVSVVVLRTGALAKWVGVVGAVAAAITLVAVVAQFGAYTTPLAIIWSFCLAVGIWRQPA